jgi:DNA-binding LacI/PurR family transcriptional regulator
LGRVTLHDIAREADVSISTVSLHLRNLPGVGDETRRRIDEAIQRLGYQPRPRTAANARKIVGLAVERLPFPIFSDIFYAEVIQGIEERASELGISLIFSVVEKQSLVEVIDAQQAEGWLLLGSGSITDEEIVTAENLGLPLILLDNYLEDQHLPAVLPDHMRGGYQAVKHLLELGHRQIAIICGPAKYKTLNDRLVGALGAFMESGLPHDALTLQEPLSSGLPRKGYLEMKAILERPTRPTAVFAISDKTALGALAAIKDANLRVPEDISLIGFDNVFDTTHTLPPLTTIHSPKRELGIVAIQKLVDTLHGSPLPATKILLPTHLVRRQSTAAPLSSSSDRLAIHSDLSRSE